MEPADLEPYLEHAVVEACQLACQEVTVPGGGTGISGMNRKVGARTLLNIGVTLW